MDGIVSSHFVFLLDGRCLLDFIPVRLDGGIKALEEDETKNSVLEAVVVHRKLYTTVEDDEEDLQWSIK